MLQKKFKRKHNEAIKNYRKQKKAKERCTNQSEGKQNSDRKLNNANKKLQKKLKKAR